MACGHRPLCRHLHEGAQQDVVPPAPRQPPRSYAPLARASGASYYDSYSSIVLSCVCLSAPARRDFDAAVCDTQCPATSRCGGVSVCLLCGSRPLCGSLPLCVGRPLCGRPLCGLVPCGSPPLLCSDPRHVGMHRGMAHALALAPMVTLSDGEVSKRSAALLWMFSGDSVSTMSRKSADMEAGTCSRGMAPHAPGWRRAKARHWRSRERCGRKLVVGGWGSPVGGFPPCGVSRCGVWGLPPSGSFVARSC